MIMLADDRPGVCVDTTYSHDDWAEDAERYRSSLDDSIVDATILVLNQFSYNDGERQLTAGGNSIEAIA